LKNRSQRKRFKLTNKNAVFGGFPLRTASAQINCGPGLRVTKVVFIFRRGNGDSATRWRAEIDAQRIRQKKREPIFTADF
jgi:hypothetical protein